MKKTSIIFVLLIFVFASCNFLNAESKIQYNIDTKKSQLKWEGRKVLGSHNGTIKISGGKILTDANNNLNSISGQFIIDMNSIDCIDLANDMPVKHKLITHLKSPDFFNIDKYKTSIFKIKNIEPIKNPKKDEPNYKITGSLTIKNITNDITFPALIKIEKNYIQAFANFKIDRTKWDIRYSSGNYFKDLGDNLIYDDIGFDVALILYK